MFRNAGREYEVSLPDGSKGKLGFALGDLGVDNAFTRHARSLDAVAFGLISFEDCPVRRSARCSGRKHRPMWL